MEQNSRITWNRGHSDEIAFKDTTVRFDRDEGPFGVLWVPGHGKQLRPRVCVKRLDEFEQPSPRTITALREKALYLAEGLDKAELCEYWGVGATTLNARQMQTMVFLERICGEGIVPRMPEDFMGLAFTSDGPSEWNASCVFVPESGFCETAKRFPAGWNGEVFKGPGFRPIPERNRVTMQEKGRVLSDEQKGYCAWLLDNPRPSADELRDKADELNTSCSSLEAWERMPEFNEHLEHLVAMRMSSPRRLAMIVDQLETEAFDKGDPQALKQYIDLKFRLDPPSAEPPKNDQSSTIGKMTREQLEAHFAENPADPWEMLHQAGE